MQRRGNIGGALNVLRSPRPLFDIGVIAKSSMGSLARHPRCASLMLGMRVTKRRPLRDASGRRQPQAAFRWREFRRTLANARSDDTKGVRSMTDTEGS